MEQSTANIQYLSRLPFWTHLTPDEKQLLQSNVGVHHYEPGQMVRTVEKQCLGVLLVLKGSLRTYLLSPEGREMTLFRTRETETCMLTASCVLDAISFDTQVEAETHTDILLIPSDVFSRLVRSNVHVECESYKLLVEGYNDVVANIERLVFLSLEQRLSSFLLDESVKSASDTVYMTHEQIASSIGSARVAVSRSLKTLAGQGLIQMCRGGVRLLDKKALYHLLQPKES